MHQNNNYNLLYSVRGSGDNDPGYANSSKGSLGAASLKQRWDAGNRRSLLSKSKLHIFYFSFLELCCRFLFHITSRCCTHIRSLSTLQNDSITSNFNAGLCSQSTTRKYKPTPDWFHVLRSVLSDYWSILEWAQWRVAAKTECFF